MDRGWILLGEGWDWKYPSIFEDVEDAYDYLRIHQFHPVRDNVWQFADTTLEVCVWCLPVIHSEERR